MAAELCGRGSVVEHHLAKVRVASSNLVARSDKRALVTGPSFWNRGSRLVRPGHVRAILIRFGCASGS